MLVFAVAVAAAAAHAPIVTLFHLLVELLHYFSVPKNGFKSKLIPPKSTIRIEYVELYANLLRSTVKENECFFSALHSAHSVGLHRAEHMYSCVDPFRKRKKMKRFNPTKAD